MGIVALLLFGAHGLWHVIHHEPHDLLWSCNVACLLIGVGCMIEQRLPVVIGFLWLCFGTPLWLLDLAMGASMIPTSPLTHLGGAVIGIFATRRLGWPPSAWRFAVLALAALLMVSRLVTPPSANVNLAFSVWPGWEKWFPTHGTYLAFLLLVCAASFLAVERAARRFVVR